MLTITRLLILGSLLLCGIPASLPASRSTLDGTSWQRISMLNADDQVRTSVKLSYLKGLMNSRNSSALYALKTARQSFRSHKNLAAVADDDLVRAVDRFYADTRNRPIPLAEALTIIDFQISGISQSIIDEKLFSLQRRYAD